MKNNNNIAILSDWSEKLYQLVYISQISQPYQAQLSSVLNDIEYVSNYKNKKNKITGILCYGNGYFFQYLEGSKQALQAIKNNLLKDCRHYNLKFLDFSQLTHRRFSQWKMQVLMLDKRDSVQENTQYPIYSTLSFKPYTWQVNEWQNFLQQLISNDSKYKLQEVNVTASRSIKHHRLSKTVMSLFARHQAFFVVQAILGMLVILAVLFFMVTSWLSF
ncbi:BLUF domain-containing protein [Psychrobacter sp. I-STPA6b]|uniref:BLUF domain-containing protein n=1 Tax=Psychrobacter sp. I-STPA6b TaxID=2585718 RepID=UPI001D0C44F4|nr:BLUF domain-containing protein [Psychrobacter sp. I-STPA6b]